MNQSFDPNEWITTKEAAELTGYTADYFRKALRRERIYGEKHGRDWFLKKSDVLAYAKEMQELGSAKHDPTRRWDSD